MDLAGRNRLVSENIGLVHIIARHYLDRGLEPEDLHQEGVLGLMIAAERFEPTKEVKFSTYAAIWIRQAMGIACLNKGTMVRIPAWATRLIYRYRRQLKIMTHELARVPTFDEIADRMGLSRGKRKFIKQAITCRNVSPIGQTQLADEESEAEMIVRHHEDSEWCGAVLRKLDSRSREAIQARYGFDGQPSRTFKEIGERFGVTHQRAQYVSRQAERELRQKYA